MRENLSHPELVGATYQSELRLKTKSGEYKWFLDSGVLKRNATGAVEMVVGSIIDIDERKKAEEEIRKKNVQLAKTNEELDRFVYSASHDMRAPLSSLLGLIHLSEKTNQPEELHLYLTMMKERIKTMEGFIREVTDYSRNTRLDITPSEIVVKPLVREIANALAYSVENKKVRLLWNISDDLTTTTDASRLKVVLNNLISNAYKYHDKKKDDRYIRITGGRANGKTHIHIEDNGIGIASEHQHRIFEMFYRASEASEGSGLGLYIVKETLQKLGGEINVQSAAGEGTTFSFSIPDLT
jgi:signal transduction histidine kinase